MKNSMQIPKIIASGLGTGYCPFAPGTAGALLGVFVIYIFNFVLVKFQFQVITILGFNIVTTIIILLIGMWAIKKVHKEWTHDASKIVIDEVVGVYIAILAVPLEWKYYLAGFVLFRFFDILKPLGIKKLDDLESSWSVMLDDVLAGIYSLIVLQLIIYFI